MIQLRVPGALHARLDLPPFSGLPLQDVVVFARD